MKKLMLLMIASVALVSCGVNTTTYNYKVEMVKTHVKLIVSSEEAGNKARIQGNYEVGDTVAIDALRKEIKGNLRLSKAVIIEKL